MTRRASIGALAVVASLALAPAAWANPTVSFTLTGTVGTNGWFKSNVTIHWTFTEPENVISSSGCEGAELVTAEGQTSHTCTVTFASGSSSATATPRIDKTAPSVAGASAARGADSNGWYNHPVAFSFSGTDATSGIAGCSSPTYGGGDGASVAVSGACTDVAGNTSGVALATLNYDATPPAVTASPDKPPTGAWYRQPVKISFAGTDATSGIATCTAPTVYKGPDGEAATVKGSCSDAAGNSAEAAQTFKYDATAPKLGKAKAESTSGVVRLSWPRPTDAVSVQLVRKPGLKGARSSVVYRGNGTGFADKTVRPGIRYRYEVVAADVAGNLSGRVVTVGPLARLYLPAHGGNVRAPLTLAWHAEPSATFYNVQLYRNGVKVLSAWPRKATLRVGRTWRYAGKARRLEPGRYVWYVWGARGTPQRPSFGPRLGTSSFIVRGGG